MMKAKSAHKTRSERTKIYKYRVTVLEDPPETLDGFKIFGLEVKLGKGRHVDFSPDLRVLDVQATQEPLPMDVEVNAKYHKVENKTVIVKRRSLLFTIEKIEGATSLIP
ncbi:MAG: hypothetical protein NZ919_02385 [Candidatus Caldarchaeum sp.]|nr:hypothetical protein [Candidatus Caldarchaeum sp.]